MKLVDRVVCITLMSAAFSACLGSCRTRPKISGVEARLSRTIAQECHNQFPCVIAIKKATDFSWDTMYAFKPSAKQDEVQRVLGTTLDNFSEDARKLVFVNKGRVVLFENEPTNF